MNTFNASPTKNFFIDMLTRDIALDRAILDLVDNSIDAARNKALVDYPNRSEKELFEGYEIKIQLDKSEFTIVDNCGGFSIEEAKYYAFRTGITNLEKESNIHSIGRFGIGMKRALFKMGKYFRVESKSTEDHFLVEHDVSLWKDEDETIEVKTENGETIELNKPWVFNYTELNKTKLDQNVKQKPLLNSSGTHIKVTGLFPNIERDFSIPNFKSRLRETLENTYNYCIHKKLAILLNNKPLKAKPIKLLFKEKDLQPYYLNYKKNNVTTKIFAGIGSPMPKKAGWYIYCNDRLMIESDKTNLTGWEGSENYFNDTGVQKYHNKAAMFRGLVFMYSKNAENLPITTTKTGIDYNSAVYTELRSHMVEAMTNVLSDIRKISNTEQRSQIVEKTTEVDPLNIQVKLLSENFIFNIWDSIKSVNSNIDETQIKYNVNTKLYNKVKAHLKARSKNDVGLLTFQKYVYLNELED